MPQLHIPTSIRCPPVEDPLRTTDAVTSDVPYADVLQRSRASQQLLSVVTPAAWGSEEFAWLEQENNSAASGRLSEISKATASKFYFMYFRIRVADFRGALKSLAQSAKSESLFSEEKLKKWTIGFRFRLYKNAPLQLAIRALSCRLGIESDPDIVYCRDGFFGDTLAGSLYGLSGIPHQILVSNLSAQSSNLSNGASIFVSRSTPQERETAAAVLRIMEEEPQEDGEGEEKSASPAVVSVGAAP